MTTASTPAATKALTRSRSAGRVPMAAATRSSLFTGFFVAFGKSTFFLMSVLATRAMMRPDFVTIGSLPFLDICKVWFASSRSIPSLTVTRSAAGVMISLSLVWRSRTKSVSLLVTRPRSFDPNFPLSVTGKPVKPSVLLSLSSSCNVMVGGTQTGSRINPALNFFTRATSAACASTGKFVWITPMPPSSAIAMAMLDSVTVSMGLETMGVFRAIFFVKRDESATSCTPKLMWPGRQIRSS
mmetsp:Transcript_14011/g.26180  ORF Transcript_14011/g.26180 Transcript_14011/m.26180 type:complete len:241 (-) Transcript_14011:197-919(-)